MSAYEGMKFIFIFPFYLRGLSTTNPLKTINENGEYMYEDTCAITYCIYW